MANAYVQLEVLGYVARRPGACDTFQGILHWWLYEQRRFLGGETIRQALRDLVTQGELEERALPDGDLLYSAAQRPSPPQQQE